MGLWGFFGDSLPESSCGLEDVHSKLKDGVSRGKLDSGSAFSTFSNLTSFGKVDFNSHHFQ